MKNIDISTGTWQICWELKKNLKKKVCLLLCLVADFSVPLFPGNFEQENNTPQSAHIRIGSNIMLYTLYTKRSHTNYS